jgi:sigma-B regulation protein RsbU (phosphoserine phosphatase)
MKKSLRTKTIILIVLIVLAVGVTGILVSNGFVQNIVNDFYSNRADEIAHTVAVVLDAEQVKSLVGKMSEIYDSVDEKVSSEDWGSEAFEAYIAKFSELEQTEEYRDLLRQLRAVQDNNDVDCLYISVLDVADESFIYLVDAAEEDACPIGCFDPVYEENKELFTNPERGYPPYITNTEPYGWLVTAGAPIYSESHKVIGYAMVDISMDMIRSQQTGFMRRLSITLAAITIVISLLAILAVNRSIIRPINMLSHAASNYRAGRESASEFDSMSIRTQDEIESLYLSVRQMLHDITTYIDNLVATSRELSQTRDKADEMSELAHRDALTGAGSKLAYEQKKEELAQGDGRYGIVMADLNDLKTINDTEGHAKGDAAIRMVCGILSDTYQDSPVYRVGGDEFVVIIAGESCDRAEELAGRFTRNIAQSGGGISAAIGYALHAEGESAEDVFRRADSTMYENKRRMKGQ